MARRKPFGCAGWEHRCDRRGAASGRRRIDTEHMLVPVGDVLQAGIQRRDVSVGRIGDDTPWFCVADPQAGRCRNVPPVSEPFFTVTSPPSKTAETSFCLSSGEVSICVRIKRSLRGCHALRMADHHDPASVVVVGEVVPRRRRARRCREARSSGGSGASHPSAGGTSARTRGSPPRNETFLDHGDRGLGVLDLQIGIAALLGADRRVDVWAFSAGGVIPIVVWAPDAEITVVVRETRQGSAR